MTTLLVITNLLTFTGFLLIAWSNRRLRRDNAYLRDTVNLQQAAIERSQSAIERSQSAMSLIRANQGDWPDVVFDR